MKRLILLFMVAAVLTMLAACNGGGPVDPDDNFDRMTAVVQDAAGAPVPDLNVRVEGRDTGVTTNTAGQFTLDRTAFPNGVNNVNEISLGKGGIVMGNGDFVPALNANLTIKFGDNFGLTNPGTPVTPPDPTADPGSLSGSIFDEATEELLSGVELTLFASFGDLRTGTSDNGAYSFADLPPGDWTLTAHLADYQPEIAVVNIPEGGEIVQHLSMVSTGTVAPGDGVLVTGTVLDSDTGAPVAGATVSVMVDTGYMCMPEPAVWDDVNAWEDAATGVATEPAPAPSSGGGSEGWDPDDDEERVPSMAPWLYEPQFFELTTGADGTFSVPEEVIGYSVWCDVYAEGYLNGNHYEYIEGRTGTVDFEIQIDPFVATDVTGTVRDEFGVPIEGAYVEFVFAGDDIYYYDDIALPGVLEIGDMATDAERNFDEFDAPPPPMAPDADGDGSSNWDDVEQGAAAPGSNSGGGSPGDGFDNPEMMRFRWENQQGRNTSDADYFTGFYATNADADGNFSFEGIPAGNYYVFASAYKHLPYSDNIEIVADTGNSVEESNTVNIELPNQPVGTVTGNVVDDHGNPVPDTLVNATQPNVDPFTYTDVNGNYTIENVPVGTWLISAYKQGYLTRSEEVEITEDGVITVNLVIDNYVPPVHNVIAYSGHVVDGSDNTGLVGCDIVFTPVNEEDGSYFQHVTSGVNGAYNAALIASEYNVLIQQPGYEDIFMRIWVDAQYPTMDFWMWKINTGNGGPWGGGPMPMIDFADGAMPERGEDF